MASKLPSCWCSLEERLKTWQITKAEGRCCALKCAQSLLGSFCQKVKAYMPKASAVHTKCMVFERSRVTCLLNTDTILRQVAAHLHHIGARRIWSGLNGPLHIAPLQHQALSL